MYEGLAAACIEKGGNRLWGFVDRSGKFVVPPQFLAVAPFSQGRAAVNFMPPQSPPWKDRVCAFVAKQLRLYPSLDNDYEVISRETFTIEDDNDASAENMIGFIDATGQTVVPATFTSADMFEDGVARVSIGLWDKQLFGYIDLNGNYVLPPEYDVVNRFSEGLAAVGHRRK